MPASVAAMPKDYRLLIKAARKAGWQIIERGKHVTCRPPDGGRPVSVPGSPSPRKRTYQNVRADFRRGGLDV